MLTRLTALNGLEDTVSISGGNQLTQEEVLVQSMTYLVVCIVRQVGSAVEEVADAMPAVGSDDLEALHAYMVTDDVSHLPISHSWLHRIDCFLQRLQ